MTNKYYAVLIDVVSIQKYVFASNKLKDNLGASYLVQEIYDSVLSKAYKKVMGVDISPSKWMENELTLPNSPIGYIGGGNALIFFSNQEQGINFIKEWTKLLLVEAPSCTPITAIDEFDLGNFSSEKKKLFQKLRDNKAKHTTQTLIPRHGFTGECSRTGLSMDIWSNSEGKYISMVSKAKVEASKISNKLFDKYLHEGFKFSDELVNLGQVEEETNHIAVVHIDGNDMGNRFKDCSTLESLKKLSKDITKITENSFQNLIDYIKENLIWLNQSLGNEKDTNILPIRPIIIGGDDITFVSPGKLGIHFAEKFMEFFELNGKEYNLTSCAGIAITKSKYPFFKGYSLSEELCKNAKKKRKKLDNPSGSWLDFHISYGGFFGSLEEIRKQHFVVQRGNLYMRPYHTSSKVSSNITFSEILKNCQKIKKEFPSSKIKELREVLSLGEDQGKKFIEEMKNRGRILPKFDGKAYETSLFQDKETPYFDLIEILDFYPFKEETTNEQA